MNGDSNENIIKERYGAFAKGQRPLVSESLLKQEGCISPVKIGYTEEELESIPEGSRLNLGCGMPLHGMEIKQGDWLLDLGCGAGADCFLASKLVGSTGYVAGIDITADMIERAKSNSKEGGYDNIEFINAQAEDLPFGNSTFDKIISNCVINLSKDKDKVFNEAARVLKKGGRVCFSDIAIDGDESLKNRKVPKAYENCLCNAICISEYISKLENAGFRDVRITDKKNWPFLKNYATVMVTACLI